ncbi:MAG: DUF3467 domain-containing protein [Candidatus Aenigmatarchaeota archaeon]
MDEHERKINVNIDHGETFFVNSISIINDPSKFFIDFRQTTPRTDHLDGKEQVSIVIKHRTVGMDPVLAKDFLRILKENVEGYEKQFGEIKMPKPPKNVGKQKKNVSSKTTSTDHQRYIG